MIIETERLILRKWTQDDAESLFTYAKNPNVGPIAGWPPHKDIDHMSLIICKTKDNVLAQYATSAINVPVGIRI